MTSSDLLGAVDLCHRYIFVQMPAALLVLEGAIVCDDRVPPEYERCTLHSDHIRNDPM